ncbi:MAG: hypothetical protein M0R06_25885 [Sphaerochaeta sp.]|jgi:hypothetical protein|nr:hypothetical protein [Sphaerochaeta sp.]
MSGDTYFEVATMGDFQVGRRKIRVRKVKPLDTGCMWFRDCEACGWESCVAQCVDRYDSPRAVAARGEAFRTMLSGGLPRRRLAEFFGVTEQELTATAAIAAGPGVGRRFDEESREEVKAEVIRRCSSGEAMASVAGVIGVSTRTVIAWCGHGPGHNAGASNRRRRDDPVTPDIETSSYLLERC